MPNTLSTNSETGILRLFNYHLEKVAEKTLYATPVVYELADKHPLPMNSGKTIYVPRHFAQNAIRTLSEGTILALCATSGDMYSATVAAYGDARGYSDFLIDIHEVPAMVANDIEGMTMYAAQHVDTLLTDILELSSTVGTWVSPDGATPIDDVLDTTNLKQRYLFDATAILAGNNAPTYGDGLYATVVHPRGEHDLFVNTSATGQMGQVGSLNDNFMQMTDIGAAKLARMTAGILGGQRVIRSTHSCRSLYAATDTWSAGAGGMSAANSGYRAFSLGPGALGAVDLGTSRFKTYVKGFPTGGTYDPIEQQMTAGIKFRFAAIQKRTAASLVKTSHGKVL